MSRRSLSITEAEAGRPHPAVEAAALALIRAIAEAGLSGKFLDITTVLTPREGGVCRWSGLPASGSGIPLKGQL
ncbi:hypothetical protein D3869_30290 (plasmid) [Azospirillum brasilense]|uniref:Uncharacterized protein n=1 Tax=Azospirillum brasilense TaxID=192 RepID=A0A4D8RS58_AZOBR|nr:hypothetical protein [Azospirillum brasilense]QCO19532.1 hypothetical protein D3869_30290 [Azospirillum brasilense]